MKKDVDHLPAAQRGELERVQRVLMDEFAEAITKATSPNRKNGKILKFILFGSYARDDWVDKPENGYQSDYDLLVIVNRNDLTDIAHYWYVAEDKILRDAEIKRPVNIIVHSLDEVNQSLKRGEYFWVDIARDGIVLYELPCHQLATPMPLIPADAYAMATGKVRWVFQIVHHDLWDYDVAAQPVLTDFRSNGQPRPALITISKTADAFVLDRETGQPLSRVVERRVPQGAVPGDFTAPTQPFSVDMPNFTGPEPTEKRAWGLTPLDQLWCRIAFKKMRYEGRYTPPREDVSIMFPGSGGGVNWGSVSIDEGRRIMIVNSTHMPMHNQLITAEEVVRRGMQKMEIGGPGVSLELFRLGVPQWGAPYGGVVNNPFLSPLRVPCMQPPYGTVSAVNLDTRKVMWSKPIGLADRMGPLGMSSLLPVTMGLPTLGGSLTTRGGLTFIATTPDRRLRAYETVTGRLLWQADLPANANAIPMSYIGADGRQYIVIAAGGSTALAFNDKNILMAFALKKL